MLQDLQPNVKEAFFPHNRQTVTTSAGPISKTMNWLARKHRTGNVYTRRGSRGDRYDEQCNGTLATIVWPSDEDLVRAIQADTGVERVDMAAYGIDGALADDRWHH